MNAFVGARELCLASVAGFSLQVGNNDLLDFQSATAAADVGATLLWLCYGGGAVYGGVVELQLLNCSCAVAVAKS